MGNRKVLPVKLCVRNISKVIFEFLQVKPGVSFEGVVGLDVRLLGVGWWGRQSRHEGE